MLNNAFDCLQYANGEPCTICGHVMTTSERRQQESVLPTAIIPGSLYLGSYDTASRSEILKAMGITHILNVSGASCLQSYNRVYHRMCGGVPCGQREREGLRGTLLDDAARGSAWSSWAVAAALVAAGHCVEACMHRDAVTVRASSFGMSDAAALLAWIRQGLCIGAHTPQC